jgi:hypothetical protein
MSLQPAKTDIFKVEKAQRSIGREKSQSKTRQAKGQAIRRTTVPNHWGFIRAFAQTTRAISKACARTTRSLSLSLSHVPALEDLARAALRRKYLEPKTDWPRHSTDSTLERRCAQTSAR